VIVLDASVAIKWFLREPETDRALAVARNLFAGTEVALVPELFYYEVFSVVVRKHQDPSGWAAGGWPWLMRVPLKRLSLDASLAAAMEVFVKAGLTGYDAAYAALARQYGAAWMTFDDRAAGKLGSPEWIVKP
jgi:predicted nucleic acid-binding protein